MKKLFIILIAALLPATLSFAQKSVKPNFDLGIKLGANFSQINGDYWENGFKTNFLVGAFASLNGKVLGGQIEGLFTQNTYVTGNGFRTLYSEAVNPNNYKDSNGTFKVSYLNIPVLLNVKLFPAVMIQAGPQFSGIVSINDKDNFLKDANEVFKSDWSGVIGLWINLPAHFNVGARYIIGLSNINNTDYNDPNTGKEIDDAWKQRTLQIHIGYTFL